MNKYFQAFFNILSLFTGKGQATTDVTAVLSTFNKVADQLQSVTDHHNGRVQRQDDAIAKAIEKKAESQAQIEQAVTALANIKALLGK